MTELKKLTTLVQEMEIIAKSLLLSSSSSHEQQPLNDDDANTSSSSSIRELYEKSQEFEKNAINIRERTDRLLSRAREKDPDKQMYNENACAKIEALGVEVDRVLNTIVSEDRLNEIERDFLKMLRQEALDRAAAQEAAKTIDAILQQEKDARILLVGDEKIDWGSLLDQERRDKTEVYRIEGEKARAKWKLEEERREKEVENAVNAFRYSLKNGAKDFVTKYFFEEYILKKKLSSASFSANDENEDDQKQRQQKLKSVFYFILQRLSEILQALLRDPEQEGLKTMRTDGERFVKTFGHPYLFRFVETDQQQQQQHQDSALSSDNNNNNNNNNIQYVEHSLLDKLTSEACEVLLAGVGFVPSYTASTLLDGHWIESGVGFKSDMIVYEHVAKVSRSVKRDEDILCFIYGGENKTTTTTSSDANNKSRKNKRIQVTGNQNENEQEVLVKTAPWFQYGDRRLTLKEPTITDDPEEWMNWHENFKNVSECLDKFVLKDYKQKYLAHQLELQ